MCQKRDGIAKAQILFAKLLGAVIQDFSQIGIDGEPTALSSITVLCRDGSILKIDASHERGYENSIDSFMTIWERKKI